MADREVLLWSRLQSRLSRVCQRSETALAGMLFGHKSGEKLHVLSAVKCHNPSFKDIEKEANLVVKYFPAGVELCGIFVRTTQVDWPTILFPTLQKVVHKDIQDDFVGHPILLCAVDPSGERKTSMYWYSDHLEPANVKIVEENILDTYMTLRLHSTLRMGFDHSEKEGLVRTRIYEEIGALEEGICSEVGSFHIQHSNILLQNGKTPADAVCYGLSPDTKLRDVLEHIDDGLETFTKKKASALAKEVVHVKLLSQVTGEKATQRSLSCAPIIHHDHEEFCHISVPLHLDVVVPVNPDLPLMCIPELLSEGASRQLLQMQSCLAKFSQIQEKGYCQPTPCHFKPASLGHLLCVVWPEKSQESIQDSLRQALHERFLLEKDRPVFRTSMVHHFPDEDTVGGYLLNTHIGLPPSGVQGGRVYTVNGTYAYHHYMQDRMDDNGWGCAYRSLQTLVSWLRHQGYTEKPVPTHKEIQQALVDVGDKEPKFVGSRLWIGSTEVSFVLDQLFGITSKILFVSSGAELGSKGRELAMHFESQGSPVMIGGGVLAHTILGVDFNDVTGDLKFLILDPHYTGAEDLKVIQDKGWCGWKGPEFWDQQAYYNLCMPQRLSMI